MAIVFTVQITDDTFLGLSLQTVAHRTYNEVRVKSISSTGSVAKWNAANPEQSVIPGDAILTINGEKATYDLAAKINTEPLTVTLEIKRPAPPKPRLNPDAMTPGTDPWPDQMKFCAEPGYCVLGCCCPCVQAGLNAEKAHTASGIWVAFKVGIPMIATQCFIDMTPGLQTITGIVVAYVCAILSQMAYVYIQMDERKHIAVKFRKTAPPCPSSVLYFCGCHVCPLMQQWQVAKSPPPEEDDEVVGQPVAVA